MRGWVTAAGLIALEALSCGNGSRVAVGTAGMSTNPPPAEDASSSAPQGMDAGAVATPPPPMGAENASAAACPAVTPLAYPSLTAITKLPDPFLSMDGTRITTRAQWACRRNEIAAQAQQYELGPKPGKPATVTGAMTTTDAGSGKAINVTVSDGTHTISFASTLTLPTAGTAPYPALIAIGGTSLQTQPLNDKGVAIITFPNDLIAQQMDGTSRGKGEFYDFYGSSNPAGAMMAWAWGVSRLIDALEQTPDAQIDVKRLGVTGCSRNGKGALVAGAFDERIVLTIPQESGSGGAGSWRVSDAIENDAGNTQTLSEIVGENVWFRNTFGQFSKTATKLPFDHHMIEGLVAPRALLVIENDIDWLGPPSTYTDSVAANTIWQALGIPDHMGLSQTTAHNHCQFPASEQPDVDAYIDKFLVGGGTANTGFLKSDIGLTYDKATWQDWDVPALTP